jgi:hypothetical protein
MIVWNEWFEDSAPRISALIHSRSFGDLNFRWRRFKGGGQLRGTCHKFTSVNSAASKSRITKAVVKARR